MSNQSAPCWEPQPRENAYNSGDSSSSNSSTTGDNTDNDNAENSDEYVPGTFEGPEKTLEVIFKTAGKGLRALSRVQLDTLCKLAKCTILSTISSAHVDAYVLSESSLFVYDYRLIMKTCGTTTLLRCLGALFEMADHLQMSLDWVGYSRKNFLFPTAQLWPHVNFGEEMRYIDTHQSLSKRLQGHGHILGPVTGDHWFVYTASAIAPPASASAVALNCSDYESPPLTMKGRQDSDDSLDEGKSDRSESPALSAENASPASPSASCDGFSYAPRPIRALPCPAIVQQQEQGQQQGQQGQQQGQGGGECRTFNLMMFDMNPEVGAVFFQATNNLTCDEMTAKAGIQALCPGALIDAAAFTPCGYSMNALLDDAYYTIHVTPEAECSYVSFETNARIRDYGDLVRRVLETFRPQRLVLTMFGGESAFEGVSLPTKRGYDMPWGRYSRSACTSTSLEEQGQECYMANYSLPPQEASQMWTKVTDTVFSPAGMACIGFAAFTSWVFRDQIAQIYPAIGTYQITGTIAPKGKDTK